MHERLEELRIKRNLSKKEFAKRLGITEQAYQNYSNGKRIIPTNIAIKVKQIFNISLDWLLYGDIEDYNIDYKEEIVNSIKKMNNIDLKYIYFIIKSRELEKNKGTKE